MRLLFHVKQLLILRNRKDELQDKRQYPYQIDKGCEMHETFETIGVTFAVSKQVTVQGDYSLM